MRARNDLAEERRTEKIALPWAEWCNPVGIGQAGRLSCDFGGLKCGTAPGF